MRVVFLDNRDSFVYNLVDLCTSRGAQVDVYRNTTPLSVLTAALEPTEVEKAAGQRPLLITSPGPGHPREAGCLMPTPLSNASPPWGFAWVTRLWWRLAAGRWRRWAQPMGAPTGCW